METVGDRAVWRLLLDEPAGGARNMAVDRALLSSASSGHGAPTLRLYSWSPPAVSLGRFQDASEIDAEACDELGFGVVRRPTGGKAVLHDRELTYSVTACVADGVPRGTAASYRHICRGLLSAFEELGIPAELVAGPKGPRGSSACYMRSTQADLSLGAAKISGSAQVWRGDAVLQHGSLVVSRDLAAESRVFRLTGTDAHRLATKSVTIGEALGREPSLDELVSAVVRGFEAGLGIRLERGDLSKDESLAAAETASEDSTAQHRTSGRGRDCAQGVF